MAVERHELDFVRFAVTVDMHHGAYISGLKTVLRQRRLQNYSLVLD
jgi:hypothetical protein